MVELHEPVEDLLGDGPAVDVADPGGIESFGIVAERPTVNPGRTPARLSRLGGERIGSEADESENDESTDGPSEPPASNVPVRPPPRRWPDRIELYQPPPSAVPIAWKTWLVPEVPDSITGAIRRNAATTVNAAQSFAIWSSSVAMWRTPPHEASAFSRGAKEQIHYQAGTPSHGPEVIDFVKVADVDPGHRTQSCAKCTETRHLFGTPRADEVPAHELALERIPVDAEQAGRLRVVPARPFERSQHELALEVVGRL
jgi:hypothetical protein